jgi:hypothetical protein
MTAQHMPAPQQQHGYGWTEHQPQSNMTVPPQTQIPPVYSTALGNGSGTGSTVSGWPMAQSGDFLPHARELCCSAPVCAALAEPRSSS